MKHARKDYRPHPGPCGPHPSRRAGAWADEAELIGADWRIVSHEAQIPDLPGERGEDG